MSTKTPPAIFDATVSLLGELTAISSPSGDVQGLRAASRCLGEAFEERGMRAEIRDEPGAGGSLQPVLTVRGPAAGERGYLLVIGHLDTVLAAEPPERRDGRFFATGAIDMKGGLVTLAGALDLLAERGRREAAGDVLLVVVPDEEIGGPLSARMVETLGPAARGLLVLEPGMGSGGDETVVIGRRGMFQWDLDVEGRAAHAGNGYWQGRSALFAAADWCARARTLAEPGPGPTVNAGRLVAGDRSFVDHLAENAGLVGTSRQINVVPDRARVEGEARFRRAEDGVRLSRRMAALAAEVAGEHEVEIDFRDGPHLPPVEVSDASRSWAQAAIAIAGRHGWRLRLQEDRAGISFPNFLPAGTDVPILDGLGPAGGGMHTREEFLDLDSLDRRIVLLAELLEAIHPGA